MSYRTTLSASSESASSPVPSSACVDLPDLDVDVFAFLQSCTEFMSQPLLTPSPVHSVPLILPNAAATPPYSSDEGSISGDTLPSKPSAHISQFALDPALLTMGANQHFNTRNASNLPIPSSSTSSRSAQSYSQSQSPPLAFSFDTQCIFSSGPQTYPVASYFPQQSSGPAPPSLESSPPWQTTDTEANASGLEVDFDPEHAATDTDVNTSQSTACPTKSKSSKVVKDAIPRPPNAWILYRSDILKDLASGNDIPGLDVVLSTMGYNPSTSASSDESAIEASTGKGKWRAAAEVGMMPPPNLKPPKKFKKGVKPPTEEFLSLGRGKTGKGLPQADISKLISNLWKNETKERKAFYERKADLKKLEHQKKYPDYKFQPMRKVDKIKQREEKEREKEEAKRQKEQQRQAASGRAKRIPRTRTRLSPAPYSVLNLERRPDLGSLGRSLSYSDESRSRPQWENEPRPMYPVPRRDTEPSLPEAMFDPLGVYPFPVPGNALPSLVPQAQGFNNEGPSAMIAQQYNAWQQQVQPQSAVYPAQHQDVGPQMKHELLSAPTMAQPTSSSSRSSRSSTSRSRSELSTSASSSLGIHAGAHSAVPFIAESLPMDVQGRPMPILGLDDIQPFPEDDGDNPADLAEMWWNLQDDDVRDDLQQNGGPSGLLADERTLQMFEIDPEQSSTARHSAAPSGADTTGPPPSPSSTFLTQDPFGFSGQSAYAYPQGYVPMYVSVVPEDGNVDPSAPYFTPGFDANLPYLPLEASLDPALFDPAGLSFDDQGPFLSAQQPMSPTDSWSGGPTPREATFLRAAQEAQNRVASTSSNEGTVRTVSSAQGAPRYVSSSAYPPTPLSVDPTGLPTVGGINDRTTSFSALAAVMSNHGMSVPDDLLGWDEEEVVEPEQTKEPVKDRVPSTNQVSRVPTPVSAASPIKEKLEITNKDHTLGPRSLTTRSRAVASKFDAEGVM